MIQKVPIKPVLIDLPALSSSESVKESHKDFYHKLDDDHKDEEPSSGRVQQGLQLTSSLISQQFAQTSA